MPPLSQPQSTGPDPICLTACAAILHDPISHPGILGTYGVYHYRGCWSRRWSHSRYCPRRSVCYYSGGTVYATGTAYKTRSVLKAKLSPIRYAAVSAKRPSGPQQYPLPPVAVSLCHLRDGLQHIAQQDLASSFVAGGRRSDQYAGGASARLSRAGGYRVRSVDAR